MYVQIPEFTATQQKDAQAELLKLRLGYAEANLAQRCQAEDYLAMVKQTAPKGEATAITAAYCHTCDSVTRVTQEQTLALMKAEVAKQTGMTTVAADIIFGHPAMQAQIRMLVGIPRFMDAASHVIIQCLRNMQLPLTDADIRHVIEGSYFNIVAVLVSWRTFARHMLQLRHGAVLHGCTVNFCYKDPCYNNTLI